jgi:DNA-binding response OmpR family regulator
MKILIAEDVKELRDSIINFLNHNGFVSESASDYYEAISKVSIYDYDIVVVEVVDINLISGSGLDVIKTIKYQEKKY